jgi:phage virion morphogenesis protein
MSGVRLHLDDRELLAGTARLDQALEDMTPLMDAIGAQLVANIEDRFDAEAGPEGKAWKPSLRALVEGGRTMTKSARLRDSMSYEPSAKSVAAGTNVIYAGIHQGGGVITPKSGKALQFRLPGGQYVTVAAVTIPERPFLGFDAEDRADIAALSERYVAGEWRP